LQRQFRDAARRESRLRRNVHLVSGAAIRFDGQVVVFDPRARASPTITAFSAGEARNGTLRS
jgi:hypothetical protein